MKAKESPHPKGCEVFDVDLKLSDSIERIRVYFRRSDCSFYVKNSENRYFAFRDPELELLDTVLPPSKIELCLRSEKVPLFSYPTGAEDTVSDIVLSKWEKLGDIAASKAFSEAVFHLYERVNDTEYVFVQEVTDFTALSDASPDSVVRCVVRWELFEEVDLLHYYLFSLGTD